MGYVGPVSACKGGGGGGIPHGAGEVGSWDSLWKEIWVLRGEQKFVTFF